MKISNIRVKTDEKQISLVADCQIRFWGKDLVYFAIDKKYQDYLYKDASPFAAALLVPAMRLGEDLIITGSVSERFYFGLYKIMEIMSGWNLGLKKINISVDNITKDEISSDKIASFFSGGVDSFYTYLKHKPDPQEAVNSFILIKGYDIDPRNKDLWQTTLDNITAIVNKEKIELVVVGSNIRSLIEPIISWDFTHGGCLAAVGLFLRSGFKKIYIPSSYTKDHQYPWGSHLETDKFWSAESVLFEHDGTEASRVKKVEFIANSQTVLDYLRVCYKNIKGLYNCGECKKCLRTMINFCAVGKLDKCKTLPHQIDLKKLTAFPVKDEGDDIFYQENLDVLREKNIEPELQKIIELNMKNVVNNNKSLKKRLLEYFIYLDHMYFFGMARNIYCGLNNMLSK